VLEIPGLIIQDSELTSIISKELKEEKNKRKHGAIKFRKSSSTCDYDPVDFTGL
jgi:hypothetical protein